MGKGLKGLMVALIGGVAMLAGAAGDDTHRAADAIVAHAANHRLVLLGEFHGTREIPLLVGDLVAHYAAAGPVQLALEIPRTEQAALDDAIHAATPDAARRLLLARDWWHARDDRHDGRRSLDMLDLVERVRRLRAVGRAVTLLAYDVPVDLSRDDADRRDREMAARIRADYLAHPATRVLVLSGNVHAMLARPADAPPQMPVPMGVHLRDLDPVSVRITARSGQSWACFAPRDCGPVDADGTRAEAGPTSGEYTDVVVLERFHVARLIGAPTAHRPAD
jgi:hypothetical protein